ISLPNPLLPIQKLNAKTSINYQRSHLTYRKISKKRPQFFLREGYGAKYAISVGERNHDLSLHNAGNEPF
nr:translocase complex, SecE/Sec61-gamma subunit [Tanacetum cinerariifolium]